MCPFQCLQIAVGLFGISLQTFSPDGQLYCAGTAAGDLAVWRVR